LDQPVVVGRLQCGGLYGFSRSALNPIPRRLGAGGFSECSERLDWVVRGFIHADAAFWAGKLSTTENSRRLGYKARAATRANETKTEYAKNAEEEKNQHGHPKVVVKPRSRPPASGQYADGHQANEEKSIPAAQRLPNRQNHRGFLKVVMIVGYICHFFMGVLMERRILLLCGLAVGAFVLTFVFSSRYFGLWRSDAASSTRAAAQPHEAMVTPTREVAPAAAPMNPATAAAPPEPVQSEPNSAPDVDDGQRENTEMPARRDRAADHSARTR
jgi:hypothetical protein